MRHVDLTEFLKKITSLERRLEVYIINTDLGLDWICWRNHNKIIDNYIVEKIRSRNAIIF